MKTCPTCKTQIAPNANPCPNCGHKFTTVSGVFIAIIVGLVIGGFLFFRR